MASKNEYIKEKSNYLRGTILEGLADQSTGAISEDDSQLTKFHGTYIQDDRDLRNERRKQKLERAYSFMIRVRVPGGVCSPEQWMAMDDIADTYANGTLKLTTRQAFQFHGVFKTALKRTMQAINKSLLDTIAACGDVTRNVMCNPNPFVSEQHAEILDLSRRLSDHLLPRTRAYHEIWLDEKKVSSSAEEEEPLYGATYLPRKFKIAVAVPPSNDVDVYASDLGFIAVVESGKIVGYNVTVGGGMGMSHNQKETFPRLADELGFCRPDQTVDVAEKVMLVQRDFGNRDNRKRARLKYTIEDRGLDWFRSEVQERLGYALDAPREISFENTGDRYGWVKGVDGKWHYTLFVLSGRVRDAEGHLLKTALRRIAAFHKGDFRLTANQNVVIAQVAESDKERIIQTLREHGVDPDNKLMGLRRNVMSCVALPTCGMALAESERFLPGFLDRLETLMNEAGLRDDDIVLRVTGCANGCARPYLAEIGLVGRIPGKYNLYLGAAFNGSRLNKLYKDAATEDEIIAALEPLLKRYAVERNEGEHFGDFVIRIGVIKPTLRGAEFHD